MAYQLPVIDRHYTPRTLAPATMRVGDLARRTGKTVRALHLYEERGLLEPAERSAGGYRMFDEHAITRVNWIVKMQDMGYSLSALQKMQRQWEQHASAPDAMRELEATLTQRLKDTREQLRKLRALEAELQASLEYLQTCPSCHPKVELDACPECGRHAQGVTAPDLVAGFHQNVVDASAADARGD